MGLIYLINISKLWWGFYGKGVLIVWLGVVIGKRKFFYFYILISWYIIFIIIIYKYICIFFGNCNGKNK